MSLAYLCDKCPAKNVVESTTPLPNGWTEMVIERSTGVMNNPKVRKHLCPRCSTGLDQALREEPSQSPNLLTDPASPR